MNLYVIPTFFFIAFGIIIMLVSIKKTGLLLKIIQESKYIESWKWLRILMIFFLIGYIILGAYLISETVGIIHLTMGIIFFFGSVFVLVAVIIEKNTIVDLIASNKELDTLIYKCAHDLREPIARLKGMCYLSKLEMEKQVNISYLLKLNDTVDEMDRIHSRLLRTQEIKIKNIEYNIINFKNIINEVCKNHSEIENLKIKLDISNDDKIKIQSDSLLLTRLLENIISNSVIFRDNKKKDSYIRIKIQTTKHKLIISVSDNGIGIPKEKTKDLFNIFFIGTSSSKGFGLGLYEAKIITNKLKGNIILKNSNDQYTEFEISLPI